MHTLTQSWGMIIEQSSDERLGICRKMEVHFYLILNTCRIDCANTWYNVVTQDPNRPQYALGVGSLKKKAVALHSRHQLPPRTKSSAATTPFSCENCHGLRSLDTPILCVVMDPSKIHSSVFVVVLFSASPFCIWHS